MAKQPVQIANVDTVPRRIAGNLIEPNKLVTVFLDDSELAEVQRMAAATLVDGSPAPGRPIVRTGDAIDRSNLAKQLQERKSKLEPELEAILARTSVLKSELADIDSFLASLTQAAPSEMAAVMAAASAPAATRKGK